MQMTLAPELQEPLHVAASLGVAETVLQLLVECGAAARPHSGRTLLHHLVGTFSLLKQWDADEDICLGGLFHSIYGTNAFKHQSLTPASRSALQGLIGLRAEYLAWSFGRIDRPRAILHALRRIADPLCVGKVALTDFCATPSDWRALATIECANLVEQRTALNKIREFFCLAIDLPGSLPDAATVALRRTLASEEQRAVPNSYLSNIEDR